MRRPAQPGKCIMLTCTATSAATVLQCAKFKAAQQRLKAAVQAVEDAASAGSASAAGAASSGTAGGTDSSAGADSSAGGGAAGSSSSNSSGGGLTNELSLKKPHEIRWLSVLAALQTIWLELPSVLEVLWEQSNTDSTAQGLYNRFMDAQVSMAAALPRARLPCL